MTHRIAIAARDDVRPPDADGVASGEIDAELLAMEGEAGGPDPADVLIGKVLAGKYRATKVLGRGGIGVVLDGVHLDLDKRVAIKVLQSSYARDAEALERFEREAKTAAKIGHPNIVAVLDLGKLDTGEPFFVMEYLEGKDLEAELGMPRRVLPQKRVFELLEPVSAALDALHREGVIHRDVKPANVFLTKTKNGEVVKLVDFGLATLADAERKGARLTREGFIVGTAEYIAPENARGQLGGAQSDVYSLVVMAYEMLCGVIPFDGAPLDILMQKVGQRAAPISKYSGKRLPPEVDAVLARALERDASRRHPTCEAFVRELKEAVLRPYSPPPEAAIDARSSTEDLPRVPASGGMRWAGAAVLLGLVVVAGAVGVSMLGGEGETTALASAPTPPPVAPLVVPDPVVEPPPVVEVEPAVVGVDPPEVAAAEPPAEPEPGRSGRTRPRAATTSTEAAPTPVVVAPTPAPEPTPPPASEPAVEDEGPTTTHASATDLVREAQSALLHGEAARARDLFRDATRVSPRHGPAWRGLGIASEQLHEIPEARRAFERYLEISPDAADAGTIRSRLERLGG